MTSHSKRAPARKSPRKRERKGWAVVYSDGVISGLLWDSRARAVRWADGADAKIERAVLRLAPRKRRK